MKFNFVLPSKRNYEFVGKSANGSKFLWQDRGSRIAQIHSVIPDPFEQELGIFFALEQAQTKESKLIGGSKYYKRLILRVSEYDANLKSANLERKVVAGQFVYNNQSCIAFAAFKGDLKNYWVYYTLTGRDF